MGSAKQTTIPEELNVFFIESATVPGKLYKAYEKNGLWHCSGVDGNPSGACKHFQMQGTEGSPCRHVLEAKLKSLYISFKTGQELFEALCLETIQKRDIRDVNCDDFNSIIERLWTLKGAKMALIHNLMLRIAVIRGKVSTDDVHDATGERFYGDMTIGAASGGLLRAELLKVIGRKRTERDCAHGRSINVFAITEKGLDFLAHQTGNRRVDEIR